MNHVDFRSTNSVFIEIYLQRIDIRTTHTLLNVHFRARVYTQTPHSKQINQSHARGTLSLSLINCAPPKQCLQNPHLNHPFFPLSLLHAQITSIIHHHAPPSYNENRTLSALHIHCI